MYSEARLPAKFLIAGKTETEMQNLLDLSTGFVAKTSVALELPLRGWVPHNPSVWYLHENAPVTLFDALNYSTALTVHDSDVHFDTISTVELMVRPADLLCTYLRSPCGALGNLRCDWTCTFCDTFGGGAHHAVDRGHEAKDFAGVPGSASSGDSLAALRFGAPVGSFHRRVE